MSQQKKNNKLTRKTVEHKGKDKIYRGQVISVVPGFSQWYNIKYVGHDATYVFNLEDYAKGDLKLVI